MSTITGRDKSALIVIDVQNGVVEGAFNLESVLKNINIAIETARASGIPVIWVQHSDEELIIDSETWQIVPELSPQSGEPMVRKIYRSSFEATNLEEILSDLKVGHLYVTGAQTNNCVRHTTHSAQERGYDVTILADAHTTTNYDWNGHAVVAEDVVNEFNDNFVERDLPGRFTNVVATKDLNFR